MFELLRQIEPFAENDYNFAGRPPLQADFIVSMNGQDIPLSVVNLHMKCCDSGLARRQKAAQMLYEYLERHHPVVAQDGPWFHPTPASKLVHHLILEME